MTTGVITPQPVGRLPEPAKSADAMLTALILPILVRLSLPNTGLPFVALQHCRQELMV